ncbi:MAG: PEP-CTERM sorting domain-containing protein [Pirellulales bacterium]
MNRTRIRLAIGCLLLVWGTSARGEQILATLVAPATDFGSPGLGVFDVQEVDLFIDPAATNWIAWNRFDAVIATTPLRPGEFLLGNNATEIDDFFSLTITNPDGATSTASYDRNGSFGAPIGQQAVIFGLADITPDVLRGDNFRTPQVFDEGGQQNEIFTRAGVYNFELSFTDIGTLASYPDVYFLVSVPEPSTVSLAAVGACIAGAMLLSRRRSAKRLHRRTN